MQSRDTIKRHAALVDRMAQAQGIDLEEAVLRGDVGVEDLSDAVLSCTACSNPDHCTHVLDTKDGAETEIPGYCRNSALFDRLKPE
jgi:hypothetical protein